MSGPVTARQLLAEAAVPVCEFYQSASTGTCCICVVVPPTRSTKTMATIKINSPTSTQNTEHAQFSLQNNPRIILGIERPSSLIILSFVVYLANCVVDSVPCSVVQEGEPLADMSTTISTSVACPCVCSAHNRHPPPFDIWGYSVRIPALLNSPTHSTPPTKHI